MVLGDFNFHLDKPQAADFLALLASFDLTRKYSPAMLQHTKQSNNWTSSSHIILSVTKIFVFHYISLTISIHSPYWLLLWSPFALTSFSLSLPYTLLLSCVRIFTPATTSHVSQATNTLCSTSCLDNTVCPLSSKSSPFCPWITDALLQPLNQALLLPKQNQEHPRHLKMIHRMFSSTHPTSSDSWWH